MSGRPVLNFALLLALFAATSATGFGQTPIEVLYALENSSILTYNVDASTLQATQVGEPLAVTAAWQLIPSPNGHFLYVTSQPQRAQGSISVYATDATGVPQAPPVQTLHRSAESIGDFTIAPSGRFAYLLEYTGFYTYDMRLFTVDQTTGKLDESPETLMQFPTSEYCAPGFSGFYPYGTQLDYDWGCSYPESISGTFSGAHIDPQTGELGTAVPFLSFNDYNPGTADEVLLSNRTVNDFHFQAGQSEMLIYNFDSNGTPVIECGQDISIACGQASGFAQDISGEYLLFDLAVYNRWQILKIDLSENRLVETGSSFSLSSQPYFSLDDRLMYTLSYQIDGTATIQIDGFNQKNGVLTSGGQIALPPTLWNIFLAERN